ncbi:AsmA-like C-terminal region-containing protein [Hymenobacter algoricola]|uniref:AsmA-like C-terminal domain-containing protein n=1 Tax=Hymenobacter algoricola TaxID=486267 RepID=A0ABP7MEA8_9BACT
MKKFKKTLALALLGVVLLLGGVGMSVWLGQEQIISLFVQEANRHLRTPVRIGRLDVSVLAEFPRVAITLHDVVVHGSRWPQDTTALVRARTLHCAFDAWDMVAGHYRIRVLTLADGRVQVGHDGQGRSNYEVLRAAPAQATDQQLAFDLELIRLERVGVEYTNAGTQHRYSWQVHDLSASLAATAARVSIQAQGQARINGIRLSNDHYLRGKEVSLTTRLELDRAAQQLTVQPSVVQIGKAAYGLTGQAGYGGSPTFRLQFEGQHTNLQSIVALLPPRLVRRLERYRSRGEVYFRGELQRGPAGGKPRIDGQFGCRDASFYHPDYQESVEHVFLRGTFSNGARRGATTTFVALQELRGNLHGRAFSGSGRYENLQDPTIQLSLRADLDVARALRFFPVAAVRSASGQARLTVQLAGNLRQLRTRPATALARSAGRLTLRGVSLQLRDYTLPLTGLTGDFRLRRNDIVVTGFTGRLGRSDFQVNGALRNALSGQQQLHQPLLIEASVVSRLLDLDQLLSSSGAAPPAGPTRQPGPREAYALQVAPDLALVVQARIQQVRFRRWRGQQLRGRVRLQRQVLSTDGLSVRTAGGSATVRGTLDARQPGLLRVSTRMSCTQLPLDSLFYVFEDFGQHFLTSRHLRGTLTASADAELYFDRQLRPLTDRLEAEVQATVRNGELNNFAPLQQLSMVASREQLRHLRFAQLTNSLYIQSRTVYVPEIEIRSNMRTASVLRVSGTHTFDQQLDYHLSIPILPGLLRPRIGGETATGPAILLAVQGTETDFRVSLDQRRPLVAARPGPAAARPPAAAPGSAGAKPAAVADVPAAPPARLFEVKKPVKQPAQPQPDQYFDF